MKTRVRFAPSPTGPLHIGGIRTALFSYLYARKRNGVFVLRVEDTDVKRYVKGSEEYIQKALEWCGMTPDEGPSCGGNFGPYRQSERMEIYSKHIEKLILKGKAYYAFDKTEILSNERKIAEKKGKTFKYCAKNRMRFENSLTIDKGEVKAKLNDKYVVRLKIEPGRKISIFDEIRGAVEINSDHLDDKILMKSDGLPTYHFANVVDDQLMEINCVIRGEEWLPSLPIHQLIYEAFGWEPPKFMHLPLILKQSGNGKLSKRDGNKEGFPVFPLAWGDSVDGFKENGFLPEGFINYLALLGWNSGTNQEIFKIDELIDSFSVDGIQKGGARFDYEKAKWTNHQHLIKLSAEKLSNLPSIKAQLKEVETSKHKELIKLLKDRLFTLNDLKSEIGWVNKIVQYDEKIVTKLKSKSPALILKGISNVIGNNTVLDNHKDLLIHWAKENEINFGLMMQCFRIALVGKLTGPDIFSICNILGKNVTLERLNCAISFFEPKN